MRFILMVLMVSFIQAQEAPQYPPDIQALVTMYDTQINKYTEDYATQVNRLKAYILDAMERKLKAIPKSQYGDSREFITQLTLKEYRDAFGNVLVYSPRQIENITTQQLNEEQTTLSQVLVGTWKCKGRARWVFNEDGTCSVSPNNTTTIPLTWRFVDNIPNIVVASGHARSYTLVYHNNILMEFFGEHTMEMNK